MSTLESLSRAEGESSSPGVWHGVDGGFSRGCAVDPEIDGSGWFGTGLAMNFLSGQGLSAVVRRMFTDQRPVDVRGMSCPLTASYHGAVILR
jgi:hypothetical protein